jgi:hypothetical protein
MRRAFAAAIAAFAAMTFASAASAAVIVTTFNLDTTEVPQFTGTNFGTVTVTDNGIDLYVAVALNSGFEFRKAPDSQHNALTFKLDELSLPLLNLKSNVVAGSFQKAAGTSFVNKPFTGFNYAVDCKTGKCAPGWSPTKNPTAMNFKIAGVSIDDLKAVTSKPKTGPSKNIFFAVDVVNRSGYTGSIGASSYSQISYVPEPGTWALLMLGFGCVGADLRRRRAKRIAVAA